MVHQVGLEARQGAIKMKVDVKAVRHVLKQDHKLSYRKIKRVPFQGNSERCKVLRSLYAQKMLPIYETS